MLQGLSVQSRKLFLAFVQALVSRDIAALCLHICISVVLTYPSLSALSTFLRKKKKINKINKKHLFALDLVRSCHVLWRVQDWAWSRAACILLWGSSVCCAFPAVLKLSQGYSDGRSIRVIAHFPPRKLILICQCDKRGDVCMRTCIKEQPIATKDLAMLRKKTYVSLCRRSPKRGLMESSQICVPAAAFRAGCLISKLMKPQEKKGFRLSVRKGFLQPQMINTHFTLQLPERKWGPGVQLIAWDTRILQSLNAWSDLPNPAWLPTWQRLKKLPQRPR